MLKIYILGRNPIEIIKNKTFYVQGKFGQILILSRLNNLCDTLLVLKILFFNKNMWFNAFQKGLTKKNHKKQKKIFFFCFFCLIYVTFKYPYTKSKITAILKSL